jgi:hypothetical protein
MRFRNYVLAGSAAATLLTVVTAGTAIVVLGATTASEERVARDFADRLALVQRLRFQSEQIVATSRA